MGKEERMVTDFLKGVGLGKKQTANGLTLFPLLGDSTNHYNYLTLDEALKKKDLLIREIEEGTVPEIEVVNQGAKDVLMIDGEELVGAKQNRILNISLIVAAKSKTRVPVSCVEAGRWDSTPRNFSSVETMSYARLRSSKMASVSESMEMGAGFKVGQGEVWDDIVLRAPELGVNSPTMAMYDIYRHHQSEIKAHRKLFHAVARQIGAVFAIGKDILGADLFDKSSTYKKFSKKILDSYILELLARKPKASTPAKKEVEKFLKKASGAKSSVHKSPGVGVIVSIKDKEIVGASLIAKDVIVHTALFFRWSEEERNRKTRLHRPSERMYHYDNLN